MKGRDIPDWFLKLLGLPNNTVSFTMKAVHNQPVTIECTYYPDIPRDNQLVTERFRLVPDKGFIAVASEPMSGRPSPYQPIPHLTTICLNCKKPFTPKNLAAKFCCMSCYDQFHEEDNDGESNEN